MNELAASDEDVLIFTWSVDYWDYLGAPDPRAMDDAKVRQRVYADRFKNRGPYTPQTVYSGMAQGPGNRPDDVRAKLSMAPAFDEVTLEANQKGFVLSGAAEGGRYDVFLLTVDASGYDEIGIVNAVVDARKVGTWEGGEAAFTAPFTEHCAVVVQEPGFGRIVFAEMLSGAAASAP